MKQPGMIWVSVLSTNPPLATQEVILEAADGTKLCAWYLYPQGWTVKQRRAHPTIIFLQENAGSMAMRLSFIAAMLRYLQCSVLAPR